MRPRHPACVCPVYLIQDGFAESSALSLWPPRCFELWYTSSKWIGLRDDPLRAANHVSCNCVEDVEPVTARFGLVLTPKPLLGLGDCGFPVCRCEAQNGEEELDERLVGCVVGGPDDFQNIVHFLPSRHLLYDISFAHDCRLLLNRTYSGIGLLKHFVRRLAQRLVQLLAESEKPRQVREEGRLILSTAALGDSACSFLIR